MNGIITMLIINVHLVVSSDKTTTSLTSYSYSYDSLTQWTYSCALSLFNYNILGMESYHYSIDR